MRFQNSRRAAGSGQRALFTRAVSFSGFGVGVLAMMACTSPELSSVNIAHGSSTPISDSAVIASGELKLDDSKLGPIRAAIDEVGFHGTIVIHPSTPCAGTKPCLNVSFQSPMSYLPELVSSPSGASALPPIPLDIAPELIETLDAFRDGSPWEPYQFEIDVDPNDVHVSRQLDLGGGDNVGLWIPITISLPESFTKDFVCDCNHPGWSDIPGVYPFPTLPGISSCPEICMMQRDALPGIAGTCDVLRLLVRINQVRLWLGFIPDAAAPATNAEWTKSFGSGKDFRLSKRFHGCTERVT